MRHHNEPSRWQAEINVPISDAVKSGRREKRGELRDLRSTVLQTNAKRRKVKEDTLFCVKLISFPEMDEKLRPMQRLSHLRRDASSTSRKSEFRLFDEEPF